MASTAKLPPPLQRFRPRSLPAGDNTPPLAILYPPSGASVDLGASAGPPEPLAVKLAGGVQPFTVLVNGLPLPQAGAGRTLFVPPDGPGFVRVTVIDARGRTESVMVRIQ
jgi:penicillin-binding protein 1C